MGNPRIISVDVLTDAEGAATVYSPEIKGEVVDVIYTKGNFDNGSTFAISANTSGINILTESGVNASEKFVPVRPASKAADGSASALTERPIYLCDEKIKIVIGSGGNAKTGNFKFVVV